MPAERHLRAVMERVAPGRSVRELTAAAGVPENRLAYWLKPGTVLRRMPTKERVQEIGRIIGCTTAEAYRAIRADVDGDAALDDDLPEDERALLAAYRRLGEPDRHRLLRIADVLHGE